MYRRLVIIFASLLTATGVLMLAAPASADFNPVGQSCSGEGAASPVCRAAAEQRDSNTNPVARIINTGAKVIGTLTGIAGVIMVVVGGFSYVTSAGDAAKAAKARATILYAVIGIAIGVFSWTIVTYITDRLL